MTTSSSFIFFIYVLTNVIPFTRMPHTFFSRQTRRRIKSALTILRRAWKRDSASLVILCEEQNKRKTALSLERFAHPSIRSVHRWFLRKGFVLLTIDTEYDNDKLSHSFLRFRLCVIGTRWRRTNDAPTDKQHLLSCFPQILVGTRSWRMRNRRRSQRCPHCSRFPMPCAALQRF